MKIEKVYWVICLLLLATAFGSSACSSTKINAQPSAENVRASSEKPAESPTPNYKKPKRVSKDIIINETKEKKETKVKIKAK